MKRISAASFTATGAIMTILTTLSYTVFILKQGPGFITKTLKDICENASIKTRKSWTMFIVLGIYCIVSDKSKNVHLDEEHFVSYFI